MKLQKSLSLSVAVLLMLCVVAACGSPAPAAPTGAFPKRTLALRSAAKCIICARTAPPCLPRSAMDLNIPNGKLRL